VTLTLAPITFLKMTQLIIFVIVTLFGQPVIPDHLSSDKNFNFIDEFEKNKATFNPDTFDLSEHSTEGGQLIVFHKKDQAYLVFDIRVFGESGRIHATYWTDTDINFIIVKRTDFSYDKPLYEKDFKVTETTQYLSYHADGTTIYDSERKVLSDPLANEKKMQYEEFFHKVTKGLKIEK